MEALNEELERECSFLRGALSGTLMYGQNVLDYHTGLMGPMGSFGEAVQYLRTEFFPHRDPETVSAMVLDLGDDEATAADAAYDEVCFE